MTAHPRPVVMSNYEQLCEYLATLKDQNIDPAVSGMDDLYRPFLAILTEVDGEEFCEVVWDNPTHTGKDWKRDDNICKHCGSVTQHFSAQEAQYPVTLLVAPAHEMLVPEGGDGEPVVEQPPPVDELEAILAEDDKPDKPGKGNNK